MSQFAGVRLGELGDGFERGVRTVDVRTGSGFEFTVMADRGLDIGAASFCGAPLAWRSPTTFHTRRSTNRTGWAGCAGSAAG